MAAEVDLRAVSSFISIPEPQIASLLEAPTTELVKSLLRGIELKAREHEQLKTQKVRLEVELETSVRTGESKVKVLKNSVEKGLAESSKLRVELQNSENARSKLESEAEQTRATNTSNASETTTLKSRVSSLEAANRDTVAVLESKTTSYEKLAQEISTQHEKAVDLRRQVSTLEQTVQTANSAAASAKFREQSLQQELDLLKNNNEWLDNELKTKSAEQLKFRKDKNQRISDLQKSTDLYISETEGLRRSEAALRSRLDEQVRKVEDLMQEVQQLREEKVSDANGFEVERESTARLTGLLQDSVDGKEKRIKDLENQVSESQEEAAEELGRMRAEIETEFNDKEAAERRVAELEAEVQQFRSDLEQSRAQVQAQPATPQHGSASNEFSTPGRPSTPTGIFSPASTSRVRSNLSMTQMYTEYKRLERELANEKQSTEQLQAHLDAMLQDLEVNKPEIEELRTDHARMQSELVEMSSVVQNASRERDTAIKDARTYRGQADSQSQEAVLLSQQIRDANAQLKMLLMEQNLRETGQQLSPEDLSELHQAAIGDLSHLTPTGKVISESLTTFRTIAELQETNSRILRMLRELGDQMESNEAKEKEILQRNEHEQLRTARERIANLEDEASAMLAHAASHVKEREMYRKMLGRRGPLPEVDNADFARSMPLPAGSLRGFDESMQGSIAGADGDYRKLAQDIQLHFDSFRQEALTDQTALKNQANDLMKRNSQLQADASRTLSQLGGANQRCEMLQQNFNSIKAENAEIQKRSYSLMETANREELKTQQTAEELVEAKGMLEGMRRESANLKAEKDLWKNVEKRLTDDIESLRNERARLDRLNGGLQTMLNERETSDSETRRRLQGQVESLENEMQSTKRKLSEEVEESKKATLRREYEHEQNQKRIDDLVTTLGNIREELAVAKTSRDHLQVRVDELTVDLRSAEERVAVLSQPAPPAEDEDAVTQSTISREQELQVEVSELRRDLDQKSAELSRTLEQVEVYKSISQQAEERLQELTETNDQYREETEQVLEDKEKKVKDLEQRIEDITSELATTNNEFSKLRDEQSESARRLDEQKSTLETEIARVKEEADRNAEQAQYNLEASKAQGQIATEAQQNYENELLKHAEAARTLHTIRGEANQLRLELVEARTQAETAIGSLSQKEESWKELKDRYEREMADLRSRREEVIQQNTLLHNQLESVTNQITAVQRDRAATNESAGNEATGSIASGADDLQEVIRYLRREKEIVDVQYHLSTQEAKRLRQQLDFAQSQLDETRLKLNQQRRSEADSEANALSHSKLMDTLNELNLHRESNVTLRAENRHVTQSLAEKSQRVEDLVAQVEPLQTRIAELENLSELREGELKLLQEDRDHWQQRTQNILSKYDRVDPAELESLKEKVDALEMERDDATTWRDELQTQLDGFQEQLENEKSLLKTRLGEQFKARSKQQSDRIKEKQMEVDTANAEKTTLQTELNSIKEQLLTIQSQAPTTSTNVNGVSASESVPKAATSPTESGADVRLTELQHKITQLEATLAEKEQQIQTLQSQQEEKFKARETELKALLNKRLAEIKTQLQSAKDDALQEQKQQLDSTHQQELETLRSQSVPVSATLQKADEAAAQTPTTEATPDGQETDLPVLTEAQVRALVKDNEIIRNILKLNIRKSVEKKEEALRKELELAHAATGDTTSPDQVAELEKRLAAQKEEIEKVRDEAFSSEKQALIKKHEEELASEKQSLIVQQEEELESAKLTFSNEAQKKITDQVALAEKRGSVKLNLTENKVRQAQAKLDVVSKAAAETPEKPVIEVWNIAKDTKAGPAQPKPVAPSAQPPPSPSPASEQKRASISTAPASTAAPTTSAPQTNAANSVSGPATTNGVVKPAQTNATGGANVLRALQSGLPRGAARGGIPSRGGHAQPGQQTNDAAPQQPATRGTGIPTRAGSFRGGRAGGRAGAQNVQTSIPSTSSTVRGGLGAGGSPRGGINPAAAPFQPQGNKRSREDGEANDAGNIGKRIRGGGAGSA